MRGYAICTERRSGSNFLCRVLESTGLLGRPREYFNTGAIRGLGHLDYPDEPEAQLNTFMGLSATPNGVYGIKLHAHHFEGAKATRWAERLPSLSFIHLERHDVLGQAISAVRAFQTQRWNSRQEAIGESVYDQGAINNELVRLVREQTRWRFYFARNGIPVLNLVYEDIVPDPQGAAEAVGRLIGLPEAPKVDMSQVKVQVQRDSLSEVWRQRFIAESRDITVFH